MAAALMPTVKMTMANSDSRLSLYVGTYTSGSKSKGIYLIKFDPAMGNLSEPNLVAATEEPSFLAISRDRKYLYAANETLKYEGKDSGYVSSFGIDHKTGGLKFLNRQPSHGAAPCHISITDKGDLVLVANYLGGNVAAFPTDTDGTLKPASDIKQHLGKGPNKDRQEAPHAHSVILDKTNSFVFVNDLGIDRVVTYRLDSKGGKLVETGESYSSKPGAGPRHFKFHPNDKFAFLNNELDMTVSSLAFDVQSGRLTELNTLSTLPEGYKGTNDSVADLHVSPDGRFVYVSNRGHDSIASYSIDEKSGKLTSFDFVKTSGKAPRNFAIDPSGNFLLAANQNSDSITVFKIEKKTEKLTATGTSAEVPKPVCLIFNG